VAEEFTVAQAPQLRPSTNVNDWKNRDIRGRK
jgi:hypothetical protein